jgi:MoxR-like ATPase
MATIATLKEIIKICRESNTSLMIWGRHGLGKSSIVAQLCAENKWGHVNMRLSQMEAADLRGLPDREDGRTVYRPPADMPHGGLAWEDARKQIESASSEAEQHALCESVQPHLDEGILFLDEINRAQDDVLQAAFELVLDRKVGQYVLPPRWSIVCAGNFNEGYQTNGFNDPAFLDRFCHVTLTSGEPTLNEWIDYMINTHGESASSVIEFASQNTKHLDPSEKVDLGFVNGPSRRSWDAVARIMRVCEGGKYSEEAMTEAIGGLIGGDLALTFTRYDCPVKPRQVIDQGVKKLEKQLSKLSRNQTAGLVWGLASFIKPHANEKKYQDVALEFSRWMLNNSQQKDLIVSFLHTIVSDGEDHRVNNIKTAAISNPKIAALLSKASKASKSGKGEKDFLDRISEDKELADLASKVAWGK